MKNCIIIYVKVWVYAMFSIKLSKVFVILFFGVLTS